MPEPASSVPPGDDRIERIVAAILDIADRKFTTGLQPSPRRDEIDAIIVGVNTMAMELSQAYATLDQRVAERTAQLEEARDRLQVLAYSDPLTGLANRGALLREIEHSLDEHRRGEPAPLLMLLDLDAFKSINDTYGHAAGDRVLGIVADRLREGVRAGDIIARLGGDEFAVLLPAGCPFPGEVGNRLIELINKEIKIRGVSVSPGASLGMAHATPEHDANRLLVEADTAMYVAKQSNGRKVQEFEDFMLYERQEKTLLLRDLRAALETPQVFPVYQPIVDIESGRWVGVEALARWNHPDRGLVVPDQFLGLAEEARLLPRLTARILDSTLKDLARWRRTGLVGEGFTLHVNVTPAELHMLDFPDIVRAALRRQGLPASCLAIEVTEHNLISGDSLDRYSLLALQRMGVATEIDDFGTGYSSIGYLNRLPVSGVKLDRSLILGIEWDQQQLALLAATLGLVKACQLGCIVEGVETQDQADLLRHLGFSRAQGYFYSRPVPAAELVAALPARTAEGSGPAAPEA
ncbi:hypothetical protein NCCP1664_02350 [Zafaria cholistanensis]|uniref:Diguanylate cyclase/phosphodiesterase n=1 Tax=Zafaria cholistanensis TaxID=1682741 RepID=A0A5A7NPM8_9MICC|nr:EAL domain-containing protein [Zafaria cholistanensis]GER21738.1 hypothetical protein NCCP1664_02350 [Zafaria cholistanensis]